MREPGNAELFGRTGNFNIFDEKKITEEVKGVLSANKI
jgi:hypothetical protein